MLARANSWISNGLDRMSKWGDGPDYECGQQLRERHRRETADSQALLKYILYILAFPPSFSRYLLTKTHFILILLKGVLFCKKDFCPILFHRIHT